MNKVSLILFVLTIITVALLGYFFSKNKDLLSRSDNNIKVNREISTLPSSSPSEATSSPVASPPNLNPAQVQTVIRDLVNAKNYHGLKTYMTSPAVLVTLASSDCCGNLTPEDAASQIAYLNSGVPFEFNQEASQVKTLKARNSKLSKLFIGASTKNQMVVSFGLSEKGLIEEIEMAASYELY